MIRFGWMFQKETPHVVSSGDDFVDMDGVEVLEDINAIFNDISSSVRVSMTECRRGLGCQR